LCSSRYLRRMISGAYLLISSKSVRQPCEEEAFSLRAGIDEMTEAFGLSPEDVSSARSSFSRY
jgi:hypothetical protein